MTRLHRFAWVVLLFNLAVILWGAFVRATGSGAGCGAHWPLCNGEVVPRAPALATMIEFTHRATSGVALLLVVLLALWVFQERAKGHPARSAAAASVVFILAEAAVGAGLVLFRLVAENESVARALFMAGHLANTFLLLASLALTAHWCGAGPRSAATRSRATAGCSGSARSCSSPSARAARWPPSATRCTPPSRSWAASPRTSRRPRTSSCACGSRTPCSRSPARSSPRSWPAASCSRRRTQPTRRAAWLVPALAVVQIGAGLVNVALLAPVWMQLVHLLLADALWIAFVLLAARALAQPSPLHAAGEARPATA